MLDRPNVNGPGASSAGEPTSPRLTRRRVLSQAAAGAGALTSASWLLAGCGGSSSGSEGGSSSDPSMPIASQSSPLTNPIFSDNKPIASGLTPEQGPLVIYDWADYLSPAVVKSFEERYGVKAQVSNFASIDEAVNKVHSGAVAADVWVPDVNHIYAFVQSKLIQPINHSYIPNLSGVIPAAADPWYDKGSRYSTPNFINTYGISWRNDLVNLDPDSLPNPYEVYWKSPTSTVIGMLNPDPYSSIAMSMLRSGAKHLDEIHEDQINSAAAELAKLDHVKWQYTCFQPLASGVEQLAYCFNGDMIQIPHYLSGGTPLTSVSYAYPKDGRGYMANDLWVIPKSAKNPVLAHLFMNHFLELESAISNFRDVGYQTMLSSLTLEKLKAANVGDPYAVEMTYVPDIVQQNGITTPIFTAEQLQWFTKAYTGLTS